MFAWICIQTFKEPCFEEDLNHTTYAYALEKYFLKPLIFTNQKYMLTSKPLKYAYNATLGS